MRPHRRLPHRPLAGRCAGAAAGPVDGPRAQTTFGRRRTRTEAAPEHRLTQKSTAPALRRLKAAGDRPEPVPAGTKTSWPERRSTSRPGPTGHHDRGRLAQTRRRLAPPTPTGVCVITPNQLLPLALRRPKRLRSQLPGLGSKGVSEDTVGMRWRNPRAEAVSDTTPRHVAFGQ